MAEQQSPDGAVANEENITSVIAVQDFFDFVDYTQLCVGCSLPASNAGERAQEKLISHHLKLTWLEETRS